MSYLQEMIKQAPQDPGVYRMIGKNEEVLYVGKAKNLSRRLYDYSLFNQLVPRIRKMLLELERLEIIITSSEKEAIILEASLIKSLKPKYNILLKDDKSMPYILIRLDHEYPQIIRIRGNQIGKLYYKGKIFGPFASNYDVQHTIEYLQKIFLIRNCADPVFATRKRPCIEYQIKRCSAPCVGKISAQDYQKLVKQAEDFLSGKNRGLQEELAQLMQQASENMEYEKAAMYRDRIKTLNYIQGKYSSIANLHHHDVIALARTDGMCCIQVFFIRHGQNYGNKVFFPENIDELSDEEILEDFLAIFYKDVEYPKEIILSHEVSKAHKELIGSKFTIPKLGDKKNTLDFVMNNAKKALEQKIAYQSKNKIFHEKMAEMFNLKRVPEKIEVYDNSHLMGNYTTGAMIVASNDGFEKRKYRLFHAKGIHAGDDYGMMKEVLERRFKKGEFADLMIIDGGKGQLKVALDVFKDVDLDIIAISKSENRNAGKERIHFASGEFITLDNHDMVAQYLQRLRDEAHRFAITNYRKQHNKDLTKSSLDSITAVGPRRKEALLNHFGGVKQIKEASVQEIAKVKGFSLALAQIVKNSL